MRAAVIVPDLGVSGEPIRVNGWFVDVGDDVRDGDLLVELLITGVTFDVVSDTTGTVVELSKPMDAEVRFGDVLGWIESPTVDLEEDSNRQE